MHGLRHIMTKLYTDHTPPVLTNQQLHQELHGRKEEEKTEVFKTVILPAFPPFFHRFFLHHFPLPVQWHHSRLRYARTLAVMSMVGWVVGLGDRHSENILFDTTTGDCMHVDLACLFDKGRRLACPEIVPFRLTQNLVDGLPGLRGVDGIYRVACEQSLRVMHQNKALLMNVLEPFVHDPLLEWMQKDGSNSNPQEQQSEAMGNIEKRLNCEDPGNVEGRGSLALSVEGQVNELISQATDPDKLSKMYIWWMPWY
eukprot:c16130_g1_i1.p1 GENE.c16130_g1_i1~~c16130_g1_i1.p1  ORF type:complete len:255 (+),score=57.86 c16130_g1_i1:107-871(+)